jgi:hypothetical protein
VPNRMFICPCLCRSKDRDQVRGLVKYFATMLFIFCGNAVSAPR